MYSFETKIVKHIILKKYTHYQNLKTHTCDYLILKIDSTNTSIKNFEILFTAKLNQKS